jgi:hypothetical protein
LQAAVEALVTMPAEAALVDTAVRSLVNLLAVGQLLNLL